MIPTISLSEKGQNMETIKRPVIEKGWEGGEMNRQSTEDFQDSENTLYDTLMVDTYHYTFV